MAASLTMLTGKHAGRVVPLFPQVPMLIGRNDDCNIRLRTDLVSRHHCTIEYTQPEWLVRDLGSSNGTFVNGTRVIGLTALSNGDRLSIGPIHFQVAIARDKPVMPEEEWVEDDADSGVIANWLVEETGASPIKKTTVLSDEQRAALQDLAGPKMKQTPAAPGAASPGAAPPAPGQNVVSAEALNALRKMNRGGQR